MFNPKGRIYFYKLLKQMLMSPCVKMGFVLSFATDQAVSFIVPIKDFAYSVCFYGSDFTVDDISMCLKTTSVEGVIIGYIAALIPLMLRLIQCWNQARQASGKFFGHLQMWNFFKYLASINTSTISFLSSFYPELFIPFILSSIISTSYSYYWDLVTLYLFRNMTGVFLKKSRSTLFYETIFATETHTSTMWSWS